MKEEESRISTYTLPISALLPFLAPQHMTGRLWADLSLSLPSQSRNTHCRAEVMLSQGTITSSRILQGQHALFSGAEAMRLLTSSGSATWTLSMLVPKRTLQGQDATTCIPRLAGAQVSREEVARWPRRQKQVYTLIDGKRSREQIARLMTHPQQEVDALLQTLYHMFSPVKRRFMLTFGD